MGIQIKGSNDTISSGDGSIVLEGATLTFTNETVSGISTMASAEVTGNLSIADKIIHTGDTNTAIRFPAADTLTVETAGSERIRIDDNGRIGIGTLSPYSNSLLHCDGNLVLTASGNAPKIIFDEFGTGTDPKAQIEMDQESSTAASMRFYTEGSGTLSERLRIASDGFIGAGTANPRRHFHLHNSATATVGFQMTNGGTGESNDSQGFQLKVGSDGHAEISQMEDSYISIYTDASEALRIASDGEVFIGDGIGTADRNTVLSVSGSNQDPGGVWTTMGIYSSDSQAANKGGSIGFGGQDGSTTKQQFAAISGVKENGTSGNYAGKMRFWTRPAGSVSLERMTITSTGVVSIGGLVPNIAAPKGLEINGAASTEIRLKNTGSGTGAADGFAIQKWNNGNVYIYDYDSHNILFGTSNGSRTQMDSSGRWTFSPSGAITSGSTSIAMSIINNGGTAISGSAYPGIAFKSTGTGGGNGMAIVNFDGNWDLYTRSGNQQGLGFLHSNSSTSGNARMTIGDDGKVCLGPEVYGKLSTSRDSNTALHIAGGGLSVGPVGNNTATREGGRYVLGWYMMSSYSGHSYLHLVTDLYGGSGNNYDYIMGGFHIHGHAYSGNNGQSEERIYFHNWSGSMHGYSRGHWGAWNPNNSVYINSNGYVTIRLLAGAYRGYIIDLVQHAWYGVRNITVTATTGSDSGSI